MLKKQWSKEEDSQLLVQIMMLSDRYIRWEAVNISERSAQSCKNRWNYLNKSKNLSGNHINFLR